MRNNAYASMKTHVDVPNHSTDSRQQQRARKEEIAMSDLKRKHGYGVYSWAEGMTRRIARAIARSVAKEAR